MFELWLDLDRVLKIQDWVSIATCDSPLISDVHCVVANCERRILVVNL